MSAAKTVQLTDLWLKMEMALALAHVPPGESAAHLQNSNFARFIRGDTGRTSTYNQWLTGDNALRLADDVPLLAAMLHRMIGEGISQCADQAMISEDTELPEVLALKESLLGTLFDFAEGLAQATGDGSASERVGQTLDAMMRNALLDQLAGQAASTPGLKILHGKTRDWTRAGSDSERLAKRGKAQEVPNGDFIQYVVPPSPVDRLVFGFEMLTEPNLVGAKWDEIGAWLSPQVQRAGKALMLLEEPSSDADAYRAGGEGECVVQIIGVDLDHLSTTGKPAPSKARKPHDLYRLINNRPAQWPDGYAEMMAMLTYVRRLAGRRTRVMNRHDLDAMRSGDGPVAPEPGPVPPLPHFYQARYRVI